MSSERLDYLLGLVGTLIQNKDTKLRKAERLMLTMELLASRDSQVFLSCPFRIGKKSCSSSYMRFDLFTQIRCRHGFEVVAFCKKSIFLN